MNRSTLCIALVLILSILTFSQGQKARIIVKMKGGGVITGTLVNAGEDNITVQVSGALLALKREDVVSFTLEPLSEKAARKQREREEKERLKRPAEIQINAGSERVGAMIVQTMNRYNYQIAEEGKYRFVFTQAVTGFRGSFVSGLAGGVGPPLRTAAFTISQLGDTTTVSADLSVIIPQAYGRVNRTDMNRNKGWRRDIQSFLEQMNAPRLQRRGFTERRSNLNNSLNHSSPATRSNIPNSYPISSNSTRLKILPSGGRPLSLKTSASSPIPCLNSQRLTSILTPNKSLRVSAVEAWPIADCHLSKRTS